ncbi:MAG: very short patch repair endonuclease [Planctomycetota bacterium]
MGSLVPADQRMRTGMAWAHDIAVPFASSGVVRERMQAQRRRDTSAELLVRRAAHRLGLRYFVDRRPLSGLRSKADMVFPTARVAVFVDGCFWHGCPRHGNRPNKNTWYWDEKLRRNRERDYAVNQALTAAGWLAFRVWEHEDAAEVAARLQEAVRGRTAGP